MLALSLRPGITRNPEHLLGGTSLGFKYMKQGKYISGDERGGFKVAKVNLSLPDGRLRLFLEGREDWLEEGLLVSAKKNRGWTIGEGSSTAKEGGAQQNYVLPFGGISVPPSYYSGVPMQAWGSGAAMPPPNFASLTASLFIPALCIPTSEISQTSLDIHPLNQKSSFVFTSLTTTYL
jgi:hypothetical protein